MVSTDMARTVAAGMDTTPEALGAITIEASASGVLKVVAAATKETHGGKFWSYDGTKLTY
jgi:norsolorinic acid ketoreductase